jgi:single-strand selective monofunctional uracil DNA glycosylase
VNTVDQLKQAARRLSRACDEAIPGLEASGAVAHATNPLDYAWAHHEQFLDRWGGLGATTLLLGMNPGPWGMAQTGVPFGATEVAKDFLRIEGRPLSTPANAHPKRPIVGLDLERQEVSGTRLWNLMEAMYGSPEATFANLFVVNHCPLLLLGERGQNITPDNLPKALIEPVLEACDDHLREVVDIMGITRIVGVGKYAEKRARLAFNAEKKGPGRTSSGRDIEITTCWHPSPASPLANRNDGADWRANVRNVLIG